MKKRWSVIMMILCLVLNNIYGQEDFNGIWTFEDAGSDFTLKLKQENSIIYGNHFASIESGQKTDSSLDESYTINGEIKSDTCYVTFKSLYHGKSGKAIIIKINDTQIKWSITESPAGNLILPLNTILKRESNNK